MLQNLNKFIQNCHVSITNIQNTFDKKNTTKRNWELDNYAVITTIEEHCIKYNNSKLNSLQRDDTAKNYTILHRVVQHLSQYNNKMLCHHIYKSTVKQNNDSDKTCRYVHNLYCTEVHLSKCNGS
jgi:spore cortex formation protein SpoVR/YcgB (stage V sporulation)